MQTTKSDIGDLVGEDPSQQAKEWGINRVGWALMGLFLLAALLGLWGKGVVSNTTATGANGRLQVTYERFVRHLGTTNLNVWFPPGSADGGTIRLEVTQDYMASYQIMSTTPEPDSVVAEGDNFVYEFQVQPNSPLEVTFELRPDSGAGFIDATIGGSSADPVHIRQIVYP